MSYHDPSLAPQAMPLPEPIPLTEAEMGRIRLSFLRRTYALFLLGIFVTGIGAVVALSVETILMAVLNYIWIAFILQFAMVIGAGALRNRAPWNTLVYFGFTFLTGLILAPILLAVTYESGSFGIVVQAFTLTASIFIGLSVFVVISRKDFSFLGGGLMIALFTLLGLGIVNIFFYTDVLGLAFASLAAVVFSGFILYDTSRILRYAGQMSPVTAALSLYLDFYNLFLALLRLLNRR
jgi:modulator of FtsH protease